MYKGHALVSHSGDSRETSVTGSAQEALLDKDWKSAMTKEYESLVENDVWTLVTLPPGRKAIGGRWHFCLKYGSTGEVTRYKARYVAKWYSQVHGRDYDETYSPTVRLSTIRVLWAVATQA